MHFKHSHAIQREAPRAAMQQHNRVPGLKKPSKAAEPRLGFAPVILNDKAWIPYLVESVPLGNLLRSHGVKFGGHRLNTGLRVSLLYFK